MSERSPLPKAVQDLPRGRVLMFAPHADDDVIGCGGTLARHADQDDAVRVVVVYDGRLGDSMGQHEPEEYVRLRREEALRAGAHLGLSDYDFWDNPEGHEPGPEQMLVAAQRVEQEIEAHKPDVIYAPWVGEQHVDHHVLGRVVRLAVARSGYSGRVLGYEVWTPLVPTEIVNITDWYAAKQRALAEHVSQHAEIAHMTHKALAISAQRAMYLNPEDLHGEGFCPLGPVQGADLKLLDA
jgi:LmbE family N-acetylglucosaminyl deacetylase